jgi:hypothetical protein
MRFTSMLALSLLTGCPDRTVTTLFPEQGKVETIDLPPPTKDVDILFLVDNSGSMSEEQTSLRANFGKFMDVLSTLEGGMPNVHIGVATSNLGQSASDGVGGASFGAGCAGSGEDGALRMTPTVSGRFIIDEEITGTGTRNRNYTGALGDAFAALADVGTAGCGIEQHLGAMKRTLSNPLNAGFLRDGAKLAVIFIADEDDCSLAHKALFEGSGDGVEVNFRCTREGIECDGNADLSVPGARENCVPKSDSIYMNDVDLYVDYLKSLKALPDKNIVVAGIVGDPDPVEITTDSNNRSILEPSCSYSGQFAYPAVRTSDFISQFGLNARETICNADLSSALVQVGDKIKDALGNPCFEAQVADLSPDPGIQADCSVSDVQLLADGTERELAVIPQCGTGRIPCWRVEVDEMKCGYTPSKVALIVDRNGMLPPEDVHVKASCVTTTNDGMVQ